MEFELRGIAANRRARSFGWIVSGIIAGFLPSSLAAVAETTATHIPPGQEALDTAVEADKALDDGAAILPGGSEEPGGHDECLTALSYDPVTKDIVERPKPAHCRPR